MAESRRYLLEGYVGRKQIENNEIPPPGNVDFHNKWNQESAYLACPGLRSVVGLSDTHLVTRERETIYSLEIALIFTLD